VKRRVALTAHKRADHWAALKAGQKVAGSDYWTAASWAAQMAAWLADRWVARWAKRMVALMDCKRADNSAALTADQKVAGSDYWTAASWAAQMAAWLAEYWVVHWARRMADLTVRRKADRWAALTAYMTVAESGYWTAVSWAAEKVASSGVRSVDQLAKPTADGTAYTKAGCWVARTVCLWAAHWDNWWVASTVVRMVAQ
jgi:hypothetical protein